MTPATRRGPVALACAILVVLADLVSSGGVTRTAAGFVTTSANPGNQVATLSVSAPATVSAAAAAGGSVTVSWSASPTAAGAGHTLGYAVLRGPSGGPYGAVGSTDGTVLSFTDTPPSDGTYGYVVKTTVRGGGAFESAASGAATVIADRTPPTVAVAFPVAGATYSSATWGGAAGTLSGTATDAGSGIPAASSILLTITQASTGFTWNGTAFVSGVSTVAATSYDPATGAWSYGFADTAFPSGGSYSLSVQAADRVRNLGASGGVTFAYGARSPMQLSTNGPSIGQAFYLLNPYPTDYYSVFWINSDGPKSDPCAHMSGAELLADGNLLDYGSCFVNDNGSYKIVELTDDVFANYNDSIQNPLWYDTASINVKNQFLFAYTLTTSGNLSVKAGATVTATVTATLTSGTTSNPVYFLVSGVPPSSTVAATPDQCAPTCSSTLTIQTSSTTPAGQYTVSVTGSGLGAATQSTAFFVQVVP